jgi:hypothetical protein
MDWKEIANRMRGFSAGVGPISIGAQWEPSARERDIAQRVITFLEDRRVLFNPYYLEDGGHCVQSVLDIRRFLTDTLQDLANEPGLPQQLRVLRGACREFLDRVQAGPGGMRHHALYHGGQEAQDFFIALGELRRTFGIHLGLIAARYQLGLEGDLAGILPPEPDESDDDALPNGGKRQRRPERQG